MAERKRIDPALNRERVKKSLEKKDRLYALLPKGTLNRIRSFGFVPNKFANSLILSELDRLDKISKN